MQGAAGVKKLPPPKDVILGLSPASLAEVLSPKRAGQEFK